MLKLLSVIMTVLLINTRQLKFSGYIFDKQTGEKLCGVRIITNVDTTYSDLNGYFEIKNCDNNTGFKFDLISYEMKDTSFINNNVLISKKYPKQEIIFDLIKK